jgi:hypothetical protein
MGLFSGGNSKSTTQNKDIAFNNVDYGEGGAGSKTNLNLALEGNSNTTTNNVTSTDFGAVQGGLDVAKTALDSITSLASSSAESNASLAQQAAKNGSEKILDKTTQMLGVMLIGGGLILYFIKKKG